MQFFIKSIHVLLWKQSSSHGLHFNSNSSAVSCYTDARKTHFTQLWFHICPAKTSPRRPCVEWVYGLATPLPGQHWAVMMMSPLQQDKTRTLWFIFGGSGHVQSADQAESKEHLLFLKPNYLLSVEHSSNPWILHWRPSKQTPIKMIWATRCWQVSCHNPWAATHTTDLILIILAVIIFLLSARLTGVCPIRP